MKYCSSFLLFSVVFVLHHYAVLSAETPAREKARFFLEGMLEERAKLRSGMVDIVFTTKSISGAKTGENRYVIIFDLDKDLLHYHQTQKDESYYFIRDGKNVYYTPVPGTVVSKHELTWTRHLPEISPFDVRCLGIYGPLYFSSRETFEEAKRKILSRKVSDIKNLENDKVMLVYDLGEKNLPVHRKRREILDPERGYSPLESTIVSLPQDDSVNEKIRAVTKTKWTRQNGIWVPEHTINIQHFAEIEYEVHYKWERVNESVDLKWFSTESMDVRDGTLIVDARLEGTPIIEGDFENGKLRLTGEAALAAAAEEARTATARRMFRIRMFLMTVGFVMIAIAVYWKIKEFRERQTKGLPKS